MSTAVSDRIEKQVLLRAPLGRVWQALTDSKEFGKWFGVKFDGPFKAGAPITGRIAPTTVDDEVGEDAEAVRRDGVRHHDRSDRAEDAVFVSLAPVRGRSEGRLLRRADDAGGVRAARKFRRACC